MNFNPVRIPVISAAHIEGAKDGAIERHKLVDYEWCACFPPVLSQQGKIRQIYTIGIIEVGTTGTGAAAR